MTDVTKIDLMDRLQQRLQEATAEVKALDKVRPEPDSYNVGFQDGTDHGYIKSLEDAIEDLSTMLTGDREWEIAHFPAYTTINEFIAHVASGGSVTDITDDNLKSLSYGILNFSPQKPEELCYWDILKHWGPVLNQRAEKTLTENEAKAAALAINAVGSLGEDWFDERG